MAKVTPMSAHKAFHGVPFTPKLSPVARPMDKAESKFPDSKFPPKVTKVKNVKGNLNSKKDFASFGTKK